MSEPISADDRAYLERAAPERLAYHDRLVGEIEAQRGEKAQLRAEIAALRTEERRLRAQLGLPDDEVMH